MDNKTRMESNAWRRKEWRGRNFFVPNAVFILCDAYRIRLCETWPAKLLKMKEKKKQFFFRQMKRVNTQWWNRWSTKWNEHEHAIETFNFELKMFEIILHSVWKIHFDQYGNKIRRRMPNEDEIAMKWNETNTKRKRINEKITLIWMERQYADPIWKIEKKIIKMKQNVCIALHYGLCISKANCSWLH